MTTIYVVMRTTGEYSDRTEWPVMAYRDEKAAQAHVEKATEVADVLMSKFPGYGNDERWKAFCKLVNAFESPHDPGFRWNDTGTSYYIMKVELADE